MTKQEIDKTKKILDRIHEISHQVEELYLGAVNDQEDGDRFCPNCQEYFDREKSEPVCPFTSDKNDPMIKNNYNCTYQSSYDCTYRKGIYCSGGL